MFRKFALVVAFLLPMALAASPMQVASSSTQDGYATRAGKPPKSLSPPRIAGTPFPDEQLTCLKGRWTPNARKFSYTWLVNGVVVGRGPKINVQLKWYVTANDVQCTVTAISSTGARATRSASRALEFPPSEPTPTLKSPPRISGSAVRGGRLTCNPGQWEGATSVALSWSRNGTGLGSSQELLLQDKWFPGTITCTVTARNSGGAATATASTALPDIWPTFAWVSPASGSTVAGVTTIYGQANTDPNGTAYIKSWCVTIDGARLTTNNASRPTVDGINNDLYYRADHSPSTGCFTSSSDLENGFLTFDTTGWNGSRTFVVTITDSNNRTVTSAPLTITTASS